MIAVIEERESVAEAFVQGFKKEGIPSIGMQSTELIDWISCSNSDDIVSIQGFILGECGEIPNCQKSIRLHSDAPIISVQENRNLRSMLDLFAAGIDDVVAKPVHSLELLARIRVIASRAQQLSVQRGDTDILVFPDGRDPVVGGQTLQLPRREKHILEYLVANRGRRVTRSQIFNAIYGIFDDNVDEQVVESHISKLRKKLRNHLGEDPVDSQRYLGYCLTR